MIRKLVVFPIRLYQLFLSPFLPRACIFNPTCSEYATLAVGKFGILKGGVLAARRIIKCNPFHAGGDDPLP